MITNDNEYEYPDEVISLTISNIFFVDTLGVQQDITGSTIGSQATAQITIVDDGDAGRLSFQTVDTSVSENVGTANIRVVRDRSSGTVKFNFRTESGTACPLASTVANCSGFDTGVNMTMTNADYEHIDGQTFVMHNGQSFTDVRLNILDDSGFEFPNENFTVVISEYRSITMPNSESLQMLNGQSETRGSVTITDDGDGGGVSYVDADLQGSVAEGSTMIVQLSGTIQEGSSQKLRIKYRTSDLTAIAGQDYVATQGEFLFEENSISEIHVPTIQDDIFEYPHETFRITLYDPVSVDDFGNEEDASGGLGAAEFTVTISDNGDAGTFVFPGPLLAFEAPGKTNITNLALMRNTSQDGGVAQGNVTVVLETFQVETLSPPGATPGVDYQHDSEMVITFAENETMGTFNLTVYDDMLFEYPEEVLGVRLKKLFETNSGDCLYDFTRQTRCMTPQEEVQEAQLINNQFMPADLKAANLAAFYAGLTTGIDNAYNSSTSSVDVVIRDDGDAGVVLFEPQYYTVSEDSTFTVTAVRRCPTLGLANDACPLLEENVSIAIDYQTVSGTATAGEDFPMQQATVVFNSSSNSYSFDVSIVNDLRFEASENFTTQLLSSSFVINGGAAQGYAFVSSPSATMLQITDDGDTGVVGFCTSSEATGTTTTPTCSASGGSPLCYVDDTLCSATKIKNCADAGSAVTCDALPTAANGYYVEAQESDGKVEIMMLRQSTSGVDTTTVFKYTATEHTSNGIVKDSSSTGIVSFPSFSPARQFNKFSLSLNNDNKRSGNSVVLITIAQLSTNSYVPILGEFTTIAAYVYEDDTGVVILCKGGQKCYDAVSGKYVPDAMLTTFPEVSEGGEPAFYTVQLQTQPFTANVMVRITPNAELKVSGAESGNFGSSLDLTFTSRDYDVAQRVYIRAVDDNINSGKSFTSAITHVAISDDAAMGSASSFAPDIKGQYRSTACSDDASVACLGGKIIDNDGVAEGSLTLDTDAGTLDLSDVGDLAVYKQRVIADLAKTLGVATSKINIKSVRKGSVILDYQIFSDEGASSGSELAALQAKLVAAVSDTSSPLHQGVLKGMVKGITKASSGGGGGGGGTGASSVTPTVSVGEGVVQLYSPGRLIEGTRKLDVADLSQVTYPVVLTAQPRDNCIKRSVCNACTEKIKMKCTAPYSSFAKTNVVVQITAVAPDLVTIVSPAAPHTLTFTADNWDVAQHVTLQAVDDSFDRGYEYVTFVEHSARSLDSSYDGASATFMVDNVQTDAVRVVIRDDDFSSVVIEEPPELTESGSSSRYAVSLESLPRGNVVVHAATPDGFAVEPSAITFTPAEWSETKYFNISAAEDAIDRGEPLLLSAVSHKWNSSTEDGFFSSARLYDTTRLAVSAHEDDSSALLSSVGPSSAVGHASREGSTFSVSYQLAAQPMHDVSVHARASAALFSKNESLVLTATDWSTPKQFNFSADASWRYSSEGMTAVVSVSAEGDAPVARYSQSITAQITRQAKPSLVMAIGKLSGEAVAMGELSKRSELRVALNSQPSSSVVVRPKVKGLGERVRILSGSELTFSPTTWNVPQAITISALEDFVDRGVSYFEFIEFGTFSHARDGYDGVADEAMLQITDDDVAAIMSSSSTSTGTMALLHYNGREAEVPFEAVLASEPAQSVVVKYTEAEPNRVAFDGAVLTFTPYDWNQPQSFRSRVVPHGFEFDLPGKEYARAKIESGDSYYNMEKGVANILVQDNRRPAVRFISPVEHNLAVATTTEGSESLRYGIHLASRPLSPVTISTELGEGIAALGDSVLVFTPHDWDVVQFVEFVAMRDYVDTGFASAKLVQHFVSTTDSQYKTLNATTNVSVQVYDADRAAVVVKTETGTGNPFTEEKGREGSYTLSLSSEPMSPVTIEATISAVSDGSSVNQASLGSVTISKDNWRTPSTITIPRNATDSIGLSSRYVISHSFQDLSVDTLQGLGAASVLFPTFGNLKLDTVNVPVVSSVSPASGPTSGAASADSPSANGVITVTGQYFGNSDSNPTVYIGATPCTRTVWVSSTELRCNTPRGSGVNVVYVIIGSQISETSASYTYDLPIVMGISPTHGTWQGGYELRIFGLNFGDNQGGVDSVMLGPFPCITPVLQSDRELTCTTPQGQGKNLSVAVSIGGASSTMLAPSDFSYDSPVVTMGNCHEQSKCAPNTTFQLSVTNVGVYPSLYRVTIDGKPVSSPVVRRERVQVGKAFETHVTRLFSRRLPPPPPPCTFAPMMDSVSLPSAQMCKSPSTRRHKSRRTCSAQFPMGLEGPSLVSSGITISTPSSSSTTASRGSTTPPCSTSVLLVSTSCRSLANFSDSPSPSSRSSSTCRCFRHRSPARCLLTRSWTASCRGDEVSTSPSRSRCATSLRTRWDSSTMCLTSSRLSQPLAVRPRASRCTALGLWTIQAHSGAAWPRLMATVRSSRPWRSTARPT